MRKLAAVAITAALTALIVVTAAPAGVAAINMNGAPAPADAIAV